MTLADFSVALGLIKDVILAGAGVVTAFVAMKGLNNWLRELGGRTKFEAALGFVRATYSLREALFDCRAPLVVGQEYPAGYSNIGPRRSAKEEADAWAHVFQNRWHGVSTALKEYDVRCLEAEALWGAEARLSAQPLADCVSTLYAAIQSYIRNEAEDGEDFKADRSFGKKVRSEVFGTRSSLDNEFTQRILSAVKTLEDFSRPHLRHR